jgi:hypothetical protein
LKSAATGAPKEKARWAQGTSGFSVFLERVKGKKPYTKFIQQKQQLTKLCAQKMGKKVWVECVGGLYARSDEVVYQTSAYWH